MHSDLEEAIAFHEAIIAEGSKALVGYETAKALANIVLLSEIPTTYDGLATDVRLGARILLDDGLLALEVTRIRDGRVDAVVHYGGELKSQKGMNLPGITW